MNDEPGNLTDLLAAVADFIPHTTRPVADTPGSVRTATDRALPSWVLQLIRQGPGRVELSRGGLSAVTFALRRTAMSAQAHGWPQTEWQAAVDVHGHVLAGLIHHDADGRPRTKPAVQKLYSKAWDAAAAFLSGQPRPRNSEQMAEVAAERAAALLESVEDPATALSAEERAVLAHAAQQAASRGMTRVPMPRREVAEQTGLAVRAVRRVLLALDDRRLLAVAVPGRSGPPGRPGALATLYALPTPAQLRAVLGETGSAPSGDPWGSHNLWAGPQPQVGIYGPPPSNPLGRGKPDTAEAPAGPAGQPELTAAPPIAAVAPAPVVPARPLLEDPVMPTPTPTWTADRAEMARRLVDELDAADAADTRAAAARLRATKLAGQLVAGAADAAELPANVLLLARRAANPA